MNNTGKVLAILLLLSTLNGAWYFLVRERFGLSDWIVFNACAVASIAYLAGFLLYLCCNIRIVMYAALLPLFFFGGVGLFVFPWKGYSMIAQVSHLIMVCNLVWVCVWAFRTADFKQASIGFLSGIVAFSFFITYQQNYSYAKPELLKKIGLSYKAVRTPGMVSSQGPGGN